MTLSRRRILEGTALAATAAMLPVDRAAAQAIPVRRSIGQLALNDPIVQTLRDGVRLLKAKPAGDPLNWSNLADIHQNFCPHGNWFFLPWHRAYLVMYERLIRAVTGNAAFALPYWDWTADRQLPTAFAQQTWNGQPNPLFEPSRTVSATLSLPDNMVGPNVISGILGQTDFEVFGSTRPAGQNSTATSWQRGNGNQGPLENNPHNRIHTTMGGIMQSFRSPVDAIFLMHHGNIDRLWAVWIQRCRKNPTDALWRNFNFPNNFRATNGQPSSALVSSLLSTNTNGYSYGLPPSLVCQPLVVSNVALRDALRQPAPARRAGAPGAPPSAPAPSSPFRAQVDVGRPAEPGKVLDVVIPLRSATLRDLAPAPLDAGSGLEAQRQAPHIEAGRQVLAFVDDVPTPPNGATDVRIFLNCDYLTVDTPASDPHYVTTFSFFGMPGADGSHAGHAGADGKVSFTLDLTAAIQALARAQQPVGDNLTLQFLPVPATGKPADQVAPVTPGRVTIATV